MILLINMLLCLIAVFGRHGDVLAQDRLNNSDLVTNRRTLVGFGRQTLVALADLLLGDIDPHYFLDVSNSFDTCGLSCDKERGPLLCDWFRRGGRGRESGLWLDRENGLGSGQSYWSTLGGAGKLPNRAPAKRCGTQQL